MDTPAPVCDKGRIIENKHKAESLHHVLQQNKSLTHLNLTGLRVSHLQGIVAIPFCEFKKSNFPIGIQAIQSPSFYVNLAQGLPQASLKHLSLTV